MSLLIQASLVLTPNAYKAETLYSIIPSNGNGDMTVARGTNATRINSSGVIETVGTTIPRLNYDTVEGCPSILLEPQRTNVRSNSESILSANGYSLTNSTLVTVSTTTPSLSSSASLFTLNVGANTGNSADGFNFGGGLLLTNSTQYTQTLFVKPSGSTTFRLRNNSTAQLADFILIGNGTAPTITGALQGASIIPYANGWYRVSWTFTTTTSIPGNRADAWALKSDIADGVNGIYVWGAQLEQGAYATSYIPTTTSIVTRNLDDISRTGISTDILNPSEGTFYVEISALANDLTLRIISLSDGTEYNKITIQFSSVSNVIRLDTYGQTGVGTSTNFRSAVTVSDTTTFHKCLIKWGAGGIFGYVDGVKYTLGYASGTIGGSGIPTALNRIDFKQHWGGSPFYGKCKGMQIYKTALTDSECANLTTL